MVKDGPCCHCGVTSTPLWRNGPPEKPILCNACGSRWRTKGSLTNYVPLHAREALDSDELKAPKIKIFSSKEQKLQKKNSKVWQKECEMQYCDQNFYKMFEGDTSNRSSSGSAISVSDSCMHFGTIDASEITGSVQSNVWDSLVPSKKRTFVIRPKPSPVEKLTKELCSILHEEQASNMSTSHDDLIYESSTPFDSEIGYGGVLIKHPNSNFVEESEASSFPINKKFYDTNEVYSGSTTFPENTECKGTSYFGSGIGKMKSRTEMAQEEVIRDKFSHEKLNILGNVDSTLSYANLNAILNFESFTKVLTYEEQQILMKHLPSIDTDKPPESLKSMFSSPQFLEIFSFFWQLLQEGFFDVSLSGANTENCKNLKRLVFQNCTKVQLLERYQRVKDAPSEKPGGDEILFSKRSTKISKNSSLKRHNNNYPETKSTMKSPKRICKSGAMEPPSKCSSQLESSVHSKVTNITDDLQDHEDACFHPRICFAPLADRSSTKVPMQFIADSSEVEADDLLLDVPSGASFPEAELLYHPWEQKTNQNGLQME